MNKEDIDNLFFKTAVHQCNDLVIITDDKANVLYVNPAFENHTGYTLESIKGKNISIVKSGLHKDSFYKEIWKALVKGNPTSTIFINRKRNGELYYEHKTITPITDNQGKVQYYLSTAKDVTVERQLLKEIDKSRIFINSVLQNTEALIVGLSKDGNITLFNGACEKLTGYKSREVIGKSVFEIFIPEDDRNEMKKVFKGVLNSSLDFGRYENYWGIKGGEKRLISWSNSILKNDEDDTMIVLSAGIDITKEKENENALKQLNESLDKKVKERTEELKVLNNRILAQNKFISKINSELPAIVYLVDIKRSKITLFNNRLNSHIQLSEEKGKEFDFKIFEKYFDIRRDKFAREKFYEIDKETEIPFLINGKHYLFLNKSVVFEKDEAGNPTMYLGFITDVTENKFIYNKLLDSQRIAQIGTWEWDMETDNLYWSDEIYKIFEIDQNQFKPSYPRFLETIHPEDRESVVDAVNNAVQSKTSYEVVHRLSFPDGRIKYVREKGYTVYSDSGTPSQMIGTVQDVTEQKTLKNQLKSSHVTLESSLNAIFTSDMTGRVIYANRSAVKMWGFDNLETMLKEKPNVLDYWSSAHELEILKIIETIHKTGSYSTRFPFTAVKKTRENMMVKFNASLIKDEYGNPYAMTASFFDVTEQIRTENKLIESEQKYKSIFENAQVGIFRSNIKTQLPIDANNVCVQMFGYDSKEDFMLNFRASERYYDPEGREKLFADLKLDDKVLNHRLRFKRKDGSVFWADVSAKLLDKGGVIEGVFIDVTKSIDFEQKLQKSLIEKEVLLKEVHHRVKNNLQIISSLLNLQLNKIADSQARRPLEESHERIKAISLIHEKLYLSEDVSTINFEEYLKGLSKSIVSLYPEKKIKIICKTVPFYTDMNIALPLGLICHEIIANAFKHGFNNYVGDQLEIWIMNNGKYQEIIIADNGQGFDVKAVESSNTLGWKLINGLAKQAKAKINLSSVPNEGTCVNIRL